MARRQWDVIEMLPEEFHGLVIYALHCYEDGQEMKMEPDEGRKFAEYMLKEIRYSRENFPEGKILFPSHKIIHYIL